MIGTNSRGWIGVDLGTHTVKLAQVERRGARYCVTDALVIRRREAWDESVSGSTATVESCEELRAALALAQDFSGNTAAVTLPMALCDIRGCSIPEGTDAERRELIARELDSVDGRTSDTREFGFWSTDLGLEKHPVTENVLAASISRDWAAQVAQDLTQAKLVGHVLDVMPLALARAVEMGEPGISRQPIVAVDWGYRRATLCAIQNGTPLFVRCFRDAGFATILAAVCKALSVSSEEAQRLLTDHGVPPSADEEGDDLQGVVADVIATPLQTFIAELLRTLEFLTQQRRTLSPTKIVMFGGGAAIRNIIPYLTSHLEIPVSAWSLGGSTPSTHRIPEALLGPAIALSALAWEAS